MISQSERLERFLARISPQENGCWLWLGCINYKGYGSFRSGAKNPAYAHRFIYEQLIGPIPVGFVPDHLCFNRACQNAYDHMEVIPARENSERGRRKINDRCRKGHLYEDGTYRWRFSKYNREPLYRVCRICHRENARKYKGVKR